MNRSMVCFWGMLVAFSSVFSWEVTLPLSQGQFRVSAKEAIQYIDAVYDDDGELHSLDYKILHGFTNISVGYAVFDKAEVMLDLSYVAAKLWDSESDKTVKASGFMRPGFGVKYEFIPWMAFQFLFYAPFGSEDVIGKDPFHYTQWSLFMDQRNGWFRMRSLLDYIWIPHKDDIDRGNIMTLELRPGVYVSNDVMLQIGSSFVFNAASVVDGVELDSETFLVNLAPGVHWKLNSTTEFEVRVPFSVLGMREFSHTTGEIVAFLRF